jgi:hypothetical protein
MEVRIAEVTVRMVLPEVLPEVAIMVEVPAAAPVARPVLLTDATDVSDKLQMTCVVISWPVPSEYVPVAVNCLVTPIGMLGLAGVIAIETSVAAAPPAPPPPVPPQPVTCTKIRIRSATLLDFIDAHFRRD